MGNFGRDDRGGRGGFSRGRSSFGSDRGGFSGRSRGGFGGGRGRSSFGDRNDGPREMFDAVCDNCGKDCQVPFRPTQGKPIYCSDCFEKMGGREGRDDNRNDRRPNDNPHFASAPRGEQNKAQFDALGAKLDKIIALLEATAPKAKVVKKVAKKVVEAPVAEEK